MFNITLLNLNIYLCVLLKALMYEYILYLFAVSAPVSLHSQATSIQTFNGLNFPEWREQVQFHLGVQDLDLALLTEKPATLTDTSSAKQIS